MLKEFLLDPDNIEIRRFALEPTIQGMPTSRMGLEGLFITLLLEGFPSSYFVMTGMSFEDVWQRINKAAKVLDRCLELLRRYYARQVGEHFAWNAIG